MGLDTLHSCLNLIYHLCSGNGMPGDLSPLASFEPSGNRGIVLPQLEMVYLSLLSVIEQAEDKHSTQYLCGYYN